MASLLPTLTTSYRRATLLVPASRNASASRATIDIELAWEASDGRTIELSDTIIVETKSAAHAGSLDRLLWRHGFRPSTISKYGTGMAALHPELPSHKWHRVLARSFPAAPPRLAPRDLEEPLMTSAFSRRRPWLIAAPVLAAALVVAGCSTDPGSVAASPNITVNDATIVADVSSAAATADEVLAGNQAPHDEESDATWDQDTATTIELSGSSATVSGDGATATDGTVLISAPGTYVLSGDLSGSVVVDSAAEVHVTIVLDGVDIENESGAAIDIQAADEAIVILADGSTNSLSDTATYADDADANAALYSAADLTITGTGALSVTGNGNDGIASADGLVIQSGEIEVTAVDDGIRGKDYLVIRGGTISVDAGVTASRVTTKRRPTAATPWLPVGTSRSRAAMMASRQRQTSSSRMARSRS